MANDLTIYKPEDVDYLPDDNVWKNKFQIPGSKGRIYTISQNKKTNLWHCSCPQGRTKRQCKHLEALQVPTPPKLLGSARNSNAPKKPFAMNYQTYDTSAGVGDSAMWQEMFAERMGIQEATRLVRGESPFAILGLGVKVTWAEIRKAYRKIAMELHPDRNPGKDPAAFRRAQAAFEVLEDQHKRGLIL